MQHAIHPCEMHPDHCLMHQATQGQHSTISREATSQADTAEQAR
jgi:hypothetical protein